MNNQDHTADIKISDHDSLILEGEMTFYTVRKIWEESKNYLNDVSKITVDFKKVTHCDSAGLALLIEWERFAKLHDKKILFKNIPQQLKNIATVSSLNQILALK